jgi:hypothetical protein
MRHRALCATVAAGLAIALTGCVGGLEGVRDARDAGKGEVRIVAADAREVWPAARAALLWNHAAPESIHPDGDCLFAEAGVSAASWGATMMVCCQPAGPTMFAVRTVAILNLATNVFGQSDGMLMDDVLKAIELEKHGVRKLPDAEP